jgi:hypothetical protein
VNTEYAVANAAYRAYAEAAGALPLIVCMLSARDTAPPVHPRSIGVWILHGALRAMHVTAMRWGEFVRSFGQCGLSAYDAVQMLRELLRAPADAEGKLRHRKAWVCVDDIEDMSCGAEDGSDAEWSRPGTETILRGTERGSAPDFLTGARTVPRNDAAPGTAWRSR